MAFDRLRARCLDCSRVNAKQLCRCSLFVDIRAVLSYCPKNKTWLRLVGAKLAVKGVKDMKSTVIAGAIFIALIGLVFAANLDTARIDGLTGLKGKFNEKERVYKVTLPRNDVKVV